MTAAGFKVVIDPAEWYRLNQELKAFDPALSRALRKNIRAAGQKAVDAVKETLAMPTPEGTPEGPGRAALIAATRVSVSFGKRAAGAKITTSGSALGAAHAGLLKVYNLASFRHPVFGNTDNWVEQQGRPYFDKPIQDALDKELYKQIDAALDEAVRAIGGRGI